MRRRLFATAHQAYRASVRVLLEQEVVPHFAQWDQDGSTPRELFTKLGALGALGFGVPDRFGGTGITDFRYNTVLSEEAARLAVAPAVLGPSRQADICVPYLLDLADDEQKARWLPGITSGRLVTTAATTEPGTDSEPPGIRVTALRGGDHYVLDGHTTFFSDGSNPDLVIVPVRTGEHPHHGISLIVVERDTPGLARGRRMKKAGPHDRDSVVLSFTAARVPAANLLGGEGEGLRGLTRNLARERLSGAVAAIAQTAAALRWTIDYVRQRHAFGNPVGTLQHTLLTLSELATEIDITQAYVDLCVLALNARELDPADAAKARWWSTELQGRVMETCVRLHGGPDYLTEYCIARAWLDSRASRICAGTTEIMKQIIGRSLHLGAS
ncbi:acyl-CoA dehydrogenase family protein [Micromonospora sp. MS34]|uniref:acyl-CoA dehydrogenase family protein n=1 Tax=Micromonospora sp. MS34 TaxID=3385971 RepID=UPI00399FA02C